MNEIHRPSPRHKPVALFVTCMVDMIYPDVGKATVRLLDHLGVPVSFPTGQTCCGQPAFNGGFHDSARPVARQFLRAFRTAEVIAVPSGSCASMIRHYYPQLFADDATLYPLAVQIASRTWELSEYLVDGLGIDDFGIERPAVRVGFHDACHGLRLSGLHEQARRLVANVGGVQVVDLPNADACCGFGGLFSVKMPAISAAMLKDKLEGIADIDLLLTGDCGCIAQIDGGLRRISADDPRRVPVQHIAEFIADGLS